MITHSGIFAWKIPWTEEPGWQQSMGSQESYMTEQCSMQHACMHVMANDCAGKVTPIHFENKTLWERGWINWKTGIDIYTL